ncbi:divalent metal cation transporter, partial [Rhizobium leguminosarum]|uniref:divalent metal cation transporter n=1 Tax=Rhizobium leguminosarum TaxID=384 RepID=UPI003F98FA5D
PLRVGQQDLHAEADRDDAEQQWSAVLTGFFPTTEIVTNPEMLYLALGILGATVMPHNLYLHSGIVKTRAYGHTVPEKREAL